MTRTFLGLALQRSLETVDHRTNRPLVDQSSATMLSNTAVQNTVKNIGLHR